MRNSFNRNGSISLKQKVMDDDILGMEDISGVDESIVISKTIYESKTAKNCEVENPESKSKTFFKDLKSPPIKD